MFFYKFIHNTNLLGKDKIFSVQNGTKKPPNKKLSGYSGAEGSRTLDLMTASHAL